MTTVANPEAHYRERVASLRAEEAAGQARQLRWLLALAGALLVGVGLAVAGSRYLLTSLVPVVALLWLLARLLSTRRELTRLGRLLDHHASGLRRLEHRPAEHPQTGEAFRREDHLYDRDLSILGPDSLFSMLATTRRGLGQRALAGLLLAPDGNLEARQHAVRDLAPRTALRESLALLGGGDAAPTPADAFDRWLAQAPSEFPRLLRPLLLGASALLLGLLTAWGFGLLSAPAALLNLAAVLALQAAVALRFRGRVTAIVEATRSLPAELQTLREGLALLRTSSLSAPLLRGLQASTVEAEAALAGLHQHLAVVEQRRQEWFYVPFLLANAGTHAAVVIERWKAAHAVPLAGWVEAWGTFDALNALALYAFEHPANTYPEFLLVSCPPTFEARGLTHPLLPHAVPNDIDLNREGRFGLISGSNMSGKSTLLRAIGLAVVLARAGAPVPASRCRLSPLALGTSLGLTDSLAEGRSRFLTEALRLRHILALARETPTLFLVDEVFAGTNSADRRVAAEAVLRALLAAGAIGALSTHDLALTSLATPENHGRNYHMASPDPEDPLRFDFLLKPGPSSATSAPALLRLLDLKEPLP